MTNIQQQHDLGTLTALMRSAWGDIYSGRRIIAEAVAMEEAAADEEMGEDGIPGERVRASWDHMSVGEDQEKRGEAAAEHVNLIAPTWCVDIMDIMDTLVEEFEGPSTQ